MHTIDTRFNSLANLLDDDVDVEDFKVCPRALAQAIDTTWGRSSTPLTHQNSVKFTIDGNYLVASYIAIVQFATEKEMIGVKRRYSTESTDSIKAHVAAVKKRYKNIDGKALSLKEVATSESLEIVNATFVNPCRSAYFRRKTVFEIA